MAVIAHRAIWFECKECKWVNYYPYTLEPELHKGKKIMGDKLFCEKCKTDNHVIEEL